MSGLRSPARRRHGAWSGLAEPHPIGSVQAPAGTSPGCLPLLRHDDNRARRRGNRLASISGWTSCAGTPNCW
ncbi:hypothetical protein [Azospirillum endophyticum]